MIKCWEEWPLSDGYIDRRLPDPDNIKHDGYRIVAEAQCARLLNLHLSEKRVAELIAEASRVPNRSDQVCTIIDVALCFPNKRSDERRRSLSRVAEDVELIPSAYDRSLRYEAIAQAVARFAPEMLPQILRSAMEISHSISEPFKACEYRRVLIDLADRHKPGFSDELIGFIDDDPARASAKAEVKRLVEVAKAKRALSDSRSATFDSKSKSHIAEAAWRNFEALVNGRITHKSIDAMVQPLMLAAGCDIDEVFPVLSWYIENANCRFTTFEDVGKQCVPIFEALMLSTELATSIALSNNQRVESELGKTDRDALLLTPGRRSDGIEFVRQWLREVKADCITICDPYFSCENVGFLAVILAERSDIAIEVICSKEHLKAKNSLTTEAFVSAWAREFEQEPPQAKIVAVGRDVDDKPVIHDRWIIGGEIGLRLGTSVGSIGGEKLSEVSRMSASAVAECGRRLARYSSLDRVVDDVRLRYVVITF